VDEPIIPHIIIPCAGSGTRFKEQGYQVDKPLIPVGGRRMIEWVLDAIPYTWRNTFIPIVRDDQSRLRDEFGDFVICDMADVHVETNGLISFISQSRMSGVGHVTLICDPPNTTKRRPST